MLEFLKKVKFVYVLTTMVLVSMVLFYFFPNDAEVALAVVTSIVAAFGILVGFIAGKSQPDSKKEE